MALFLLIPMALWLIYQFSPVGSKPVRSDIFLRNGNESRRLGEALVLKKYILRTVGLLLHREISSKTFMMFPKTRSVHTRGMMCTIDIAFIAKDGRIVDLIPSAQPGLIIKGPRGTVHTVEMAAGSILRESLGIGQQITFGNQV